MGNCKLRLFLCLASLVFSSTASYASRFKMPELKAPSEANTEQTVFICGVHGECPESERTDPATNCTSNGGTWITNTGVQHCRYDSDLEGDRCGANAHWHEKRAFTSEDGNGCQCDDGYELGASGCVYAEERSEDCDPLNPTPGCDDTPPTAGGDNPPSRAACRANFESQEHQEYCISQYKNAHFAQDRAAAEDRLISQCQTRVQNAINVCEDTSALDSLPPAAVVTPGTAPEVACQIVETNRSNMAAFNSHASSCTNAGASCQASCEGLQERVYDETVPVPTSISRSCSTETAPRAAQSSSQASAFSSPIAGAQTTCNQLTAGNGTEPEPEATAADPTGLAATTPPPASATDTDTDSGENELGSSSGGNNNELYGALGTAALGLAADNFSADNFESDFDASAFKGSNTAINSNFAGTSSSRNLSRNTDSQSSFNPGASAGAGDYGDLIDDPRYNPAPTVGPGAVAGNAQNGRVGGRAGVATNPQAARLSASNGGNTSSRQRAGRGRSSLSTRNLVNGYRNVRATDGGGSLSIRPRDIKKYGKKIMKAKLSAARKVFGKTIPLMFKNGKFVRDFLAMKEAKGFKSRQAAMEGYWRGETATHSSHNPTLSLLESCTEEQQCHLNENENIFNLMHLKVQKTLKRHLNR